MNLDATFSTLAQIFHLQDPSQAENRAKLWLLRACGEVGRPHRNRQYTQEVLFGWLQVALPGAGKPLISRWLDACADSPDPAWMANILQDEEAATVLPPPLLLGAVLATWPPDLGDHHESARYLQTAALYCGGQEEMVHELMGWLRATATPEKLEYISSLIELWSQSELAQRVTKELKLRAQTPPTEEDSSFAKKFEKAKISLGEFLEVLIDKSDTFDLNTQELKAVKARILDEHFRVAVLGEFKRGKSTLINAMLGAPDFLPAAELPCTSSLIELRHGASITFRYAPVMSEDYQPKTREEFMKNAGNAAKSSSQSKAENTSASSDIGRWRVTLDSQFLHRTQFELVDTPGLGEDTVRDEIAKGEAKRADAALIVLSAKQISSIQELELVKSMESKLENVILVINQADLVSKGSWSKLQNHVQQRLKEQNVGFHGDRIVFISALLAEEAFRQGKRNEWSNGLEILEHVVWNNLALHRGAKKALAICESIEEECKETRRLVEEKRDEKKNDLRDLEKSIKLVATAADSKKEAVYAIDRAVRKLEQHEGAQKILWKSFQENLPKIFARTEANNAAWTSSHHELTSPKKHIEEVAQAMQADLVYHVKSWAKDRGGAVVSESLMMSVDQVKEELAPLQKYLEIAGSNGQMSVDRLLVLTLQDAFPTDLAEADSMTSLLRVAIMTALALVVGYVVADVILYYILGVISGFVNPWLLAAALVTSVLAYAWKGREWVQSWIRSSVFSSVKKGFEEQKNKDKMYESFGEATRKIFTDVSRSFEKNAQALLDETAKQLGRREENLRQIQEKIGKDPEALKRELNKIEKEAEDVLHAVAELEARVVIIREKMDLPRQLPSPS